MKRCSRCLIQKPLDEFGYRADARDKRKSWCKKCANNRHWPAATRAGFHSVTASGMEGLPVVWPAPVDGGRADLRR